jgi:hypothetical protein
MLTRNFGKMHLFKRNLKLENNQYQPSLSVFDLENMENSYNFVPLNAFSSSRNTKTVLFNQLLSDNSCSYCENLILKTEEKIKCDKNHVVCLRCIKNAVDYSVSLKKTKVRCRMPNCNGFYSSS